jgi:hypothetical protein
MSRSGSNTEARVLDTTEADASIGPWAWPGDEEFIQAEISDLSGKPLFPAYSAAPSCRRVKRVSVCMCVVELPAASLLASHMVYTTTTVPCSTAYYY